MVIIVSLVSHLFILLPAFKFVTYLFLWQIEEGRKLAISDEGEPTVDR
jgi:hypothetical protein